MLQPGNAVGLDRQRHVERGRELVNRQPQGRVGDHPVALVPVLPLGSWHLGTEGGEALGPCVETGAPFNEVNRLSAALALQRCRQIAADHVPRDGVHDEVMCDQQELGLARASHQPRLEQRSVIEIHARLQLGGQGGDDVFDVGVCRHDPLDESVAGGPDWSDMELAVPEHRAQRIMLRPDGVERPRDMFRRNVVDVDNNVLVEMMGHREVPPKKLVDGG